MRSAVPVRYNPTVRWDSPQQAETAMVLGGAAAGGLVGLIAWRALGSRVGRLGAVIPILTASLGAVAWMTMIPGE